MFTCKDLKTGSKYLAKHLCANDYYEKGGEVVGRWIGEGAKMLGLEGKAIGHRDAAFEALRKNLDPNTGQQLTPRTKDERRAFFDFQVSAPKDVSVLAITFGDKRLLQAHARAVAAGYGELQRFAARGLGKYQTRLTGNLITAEFNHTASQELDAQVHTHLVCMNATFDHEAKQWYALENAEMFRAINLAGRVYQAALAREVRALGYEIEEERNAKGRIKGFTIAGVTENDRAVQSTRSQQIEAACDKFRKEKGRAPTTKERHVIATETRAKKLQETTTPEVLAKQRAKYSAADIARLERLVASAKDRGPLPAHPVAVQQMFEWAVEHVFERKAVASEKELVVCALENHLGKLTVEDVRNELARNGAVLQLAEAPLGRPADENLHATTEHVRREKESIGLVHEAAGQYGPLGYRGDYADSLTDDKKTAFETLLASTDGVVALRGPAGAGKTTLLRALNAALRESGKETVFVAPEHQGRITLEANGFEKPDTVSQLVIDLKNGRREFKKDTVLFVDEAGKLSTKAGHELLTLARNAGARVCLVGDEKQHSAVEAGDFFALLKDHSRILWVELTEIQRQKDPAYRDAMKKMSQGDARTGLEMLDKQGRIFESEGAYLDRAADSYVEKMHKGEKTILVAPTWDEIDTLNARVRAGRKVRGEIVGGLDAEEWAVNTIDLEDFSAAQKRVGRCYKPGLAVSPMIGRVGGLRKGAWYEVQSVEGNVLKLANGGEIDVSKIGGRIEVGVPRKLKMAAGDLLLLQGNDRKIGVTNGMLATVKAIDQSGIKIDVTVENRTFETKLPPEYMKFTHGYAVTTHKSQSATVEHAIVAASTIDGQGIYVGSSRGQRSVEVHVPDKRRLIASAGMIRTREAAVEYGGAWQRPGPGTGQATAPQPRQKRSRHMDLIKRVFSRERFRRAVERMRNAARQVGRTR